MNTQVQMTFGADVLGSLLNNRRGIEDYGGQTSPGFRQWAAKCRKEIKKICKVLDFSVGHYYWNCFVEGGDGQVWNVFISDVRHFPDAGITYRTAAHVKDYSGGRNQGTTPERLTEVLRGF